MLTGYPDHAAKVETTFRMGFKGGLSLFSALGDELLISSLHFDGHEHYRRRLDGRRILGRIGELPKGISFREYLSIDDRTSDHRINDISQDYDDCQLLQLTDILVGGFRTVLGEATKDVHYEVCKPLLELDKRRRQGPARMRNSKWFRGFCISEAYLENGEWQFTDIDPRPLQEEPRLF